MEPRDEKVTWHIMPSGTLWEVHENADLGATELPSADIDLSLSFDIPPDDEA